MHVLDILCSASHVWMLHGCDCCLFLHTKLPGYRIKCLFNSCLTNLYFISLVTVPETFYNPILHLHVIWKCIHSVLSMYWPCALLAIVLCLACSLRRIFDTFSVDFIFSLFMPIRHSGLKWRFSFTLPEVKALRALPWNVHRPDGYRVEQIRDCINVRGVDCFFKLSLNRF